jgi:hypothetical protein
MSDLTVEQILQIEGVCVRFIQRNKREVWRGMDGKEIIHKENALGGKYLLTFDNGQMSTVRMTLTHDGIGDTIQEAFADYLTKNRPLSTLNP